MPEQRRPFSAQFKAQAVPMVLETGKPIPEIARKLDIHDGALGNWFNTWRREHPNPESRRWNAPGERDGRRDPPATDGKRIPERSGLLRPDAP